MTILAGLGCCAIFFVAVTVLRREIVTQYHLLRLRTDSGYLHGIVSKPEGTVQNSAVRMFLETPEGRIALLRHLLKHVNERQWKNVASRRTHTFVLGMPRSLPHPGMGSGDTVTIFCEDPGFFEDSSRVYQVGWLPADAAMTEMMSYLVGRDATLPEYPEQTFMLHDLDSWQEYLRSRRDQERDVLRPLPGVAGRPKSL